MIPLYASSRMEIARPFSHYLRQVAELVRG